MAAPLVSIIIPVYNGANYLAEAIDSALAQTYPHVEVIVVDDGSRDEGATAAVAARYGDRIRYVYKPNGGVSSALNRGIAEMKGDYFSWLSHDDKFFPEKTARQIAYLAAHPGVRILGTNFEIIDDAGKLLYVNPATSQTVGNGREVMQTWVYACSLLIHRACFAEAGVFDESNRYTQDIDLFLRLVRRDPMYFMPDVLCAWRNHGQSDSHVFADKTTPEKTRLFQQLVNADVTFILPRGARADKPRDVAKAYAWLGDDALGRSTLEGARLCFEKSVAIDPAPTNPARWKLWVGLERVAALQRKRGRVEYVLKNLDKVPGAIWRRLPGNRTARSRAGKRG